MNLVQHYTKGTYSLKSTFPQKVHSATISHVQFHDHSLEILPTFVEFFPLEKVVRSYSDIVYTHCKDLLNFTYFLYILLQRSSQHPKLYYASRKISQKWEIRRYITKKFDFS